MKTKNIYIYGVSDSDNIGDNVICDTFTSIVKELNPNSRVQLRSITFEPFIYCYLRKLFKITGMADWLLMLLNKWRGLYNCLWGKDKSLVIFAGGQLFYECFISNISSIVKVAEEKGCDVSFYGCGSGVMSLDKQKQLSMILGNKAISHIFLRDDYIGLREEFSKIKIVPDVAICCDKLVKGVGGEKYNLVGVGTISIHNYNKQNTIQITQEQYCRYISDLINIVRKLGYKVEIFTNGNKRDYEVANIIYSSYLSDNEVQIAKCPSTSQDLISLISRYDYTIASRLHALIISYAFNVPFYGLSWDLKIPSFCNMIGVPNNFSDIGEFDVSKMINVFTTKYDEKERMRLREEVVKNIQIITL
ncbi:polysaccharide pyruvyl transferase family protein [Bacteroides oleiciplenus]|uniref:Polysaccharide pyruvyl transferase domain-containing protein n=1 Tax=Bacteroides oleiciplenus YIT 12058 TaxID=742727 RepID=K9EPX7_9BACE|nr:polysaccharide pyruvyl transferase family protein [Bacteroides oleiciplenus]EKU91215.1 hypothetical protein HMPREF9447_01405 [Bacteroides oleiciplenus YIT 12058]